MSRPTWDEYFMGVAVSISKRSSCDRANVGAVFVKDKQIIATGYNGSLWSDDTCDDSGHMVVDNHCVRTIHAEMNGLVQLAKTSGSSSDGCSVYVTHFPCKDCMFHLIQAKVSKIFYLDSYKINHLAVSMASKSNVDLIKMNI